jgi:hypothetical protein
MHGWPIPRWVGDDVHSPAKIVFGNEAGIVPPDAVMARLYIKG